ncbi:MAG: hypothetical protein AB8I08_10575 [Sandaracinaceae bacterium]
MSGGKARKRSKGVGRITARLPPVRFDPPAAKPSAPPVGVAPEALVVDEAMPEGDERALFEEVDATDPDFGAQGPLDTNVMLAAFDDATEVQDG